ncbi:MAG TPA: GMC family oxidoreductase N-terminal domain-containing protein [Steroidobacteraceae bacterium]|nr:GMC family oxidoreductase N-terminal domain-containing protein [Steroidobacteraceae bacterium]
MASFAETFDYVIVGAGTAGCVLAARLSERSDARVCLIEAGGPDRHPFIHIPAAVAAAIGTRSLNWGFLTVPQPHLNGRRIPIPRGRVVGGSGAINGMVYFRGQPHDFDGWAAAGNPGWSYAEVLPYFIRSESNANYPGSPYHGTSGPMRVTHVRRPNPLNKAFFEAMGALQFRRCDDFNASDPEGYGPRQATVREGRRESTASAYLKPALRRSNLRVLTGARVLRVLIEGGRATGVEVALGAGPGSEMRRIGARAEVILAGGSILSPHILLLSGIGEGAQLHRVGVEVKLDLPAVGAHLHDHLAAAVLMEMRHSASYGLSVRAAPRGVWNLLEYALRRQGPLASNVFEANAFVRTRPELPRPDIQIVFQPARRNPHGFPLPLGHGFAVSIVNLYPRSRGRITLASADPRTPPDIDPNLLSVPEDLEPLVRGLELARRIAGSPSFARYRAHEVAPGAAVQGEAALGNYVRQFATTVHHPVSTCRMGPGGDCVVDAQLRVRGLEGLRVADASIFPSILGGNTNAAVVMIAEKASDMILGRPAPRPIDVTGASARVAEPTAA